MARVSCGEKIKELRINRSLTQVELADSLHVSRSLVARWENDSVIPSDEDLKSLTEYFGYNFNHCKKIYMSWSQMVESIIVFVICVFLLILTFAPICLTEVTNVKDGVTETKMSFESIVYIQFQSKGFSYIFFFATICLNFFFLFLRFKILRKYNFVTLRVAQYFLLFLTFVFFITSLLSVF